jgi:hypothetical protein
MSTDAHTEAILAGGGFRKPESHSPVSVRTHEKPNHIRNAKCPCGSGLKVKKCKCGIMLRATLLKEQDTRKRFSPPDHRNRYDALPPPLQHPTPPATP